MTPLQYRRHWQELCDDSARVFKDKSEFEEPEFTANLI